MFLEELTISWLRILCLIHAAGWDSKYPLAFPLYLSSRDPVQFDHLQNDERKGFCERHGEGDHGQRHDHGPDLCAPGLFPLPGIFQR